MIKVKYSKVKSCGCDRRKDDVLVRGEKMGVNLIEAGKEHLF